MRTTTTVDQDLIAVLARTLQYAECADDLAEILNTALEGLRRETLHYAALRFAATSTWFTDHEDIRQALYAEQVQTAAAARRYARKLECIYDRLQCFVEDDEGADIFWEPPVMTPCQPTSVLLEAAYGVIEDNALSTFLRGDVGRKPRTRPTKATWDEGRGEAACR